MRLPIDWRDEQQIRRLFSWLTRARIGVTFGSRPVGWYQIHQCHAHDLVLAGLKGRPGQARMRHDAIEVKPDGARRWTLVGTCADLYRQADNRSRQ